MRMNRGQLSLIGLLLCCWSSVKAQDQYELNTGWQCANISRVTEKGETISDPAHALTGWQPATVPGTVLTTMLNNKQVPDPFYGMNNEKIPDIYNTGNDYYTYWFVKDFTEQPAAADQQVWLHFRGVNYSCDIYLNGKKVNAATHHGMFLRQTYNITRLLAKNGHNRLAVIIYPAPLAGNPNGGQGGDGIIAKSVAHQYTAGWDWIQPIRDRNTGIWDKVTIEHTGAVDVKHPHVVTKVPGIRLPEGPQAPAIVQVSAELENASDKSVTGAVQYAINGTTVSKKVTLAPHATTQVQLPDYTLQHPKLWWPNGYGPQALYNLQLQFVNAAGKVSDKETVEVGVREIQTSWNAHTGSREVAVNGQKIFIKGGNWIISDAMLRFSKERYDAEIRYHRDMNLNLIRIWGGALTERPEFYEACDKYGMLVFQDFWFSGDCNGRWVDPMKKEDQWTRRKYPDDHGLVLSSLTDQIKMIRNYPSLALWCGGNEITPPEDILTAVKDSILPLLDGTRYFFDYSNSDSMSHNTLGGNGDGPYGVQPLATFWEHRTFPFNSEIGSVGVGDYASLERFIPKENMVAPEYPGNKVDSVWYYHKYIGYDGFIDPYGKAKDAKDFANKAQLVNYDQYRGLMEGFSAHMWDWYTGVIIWKTQNPWTAMRGQMYDYYLDPNACLYGLHNGSEPLHIMYNPIDGMVQVANNTFTPRRDLMLQIFAYDMKGSVDTLTQVFADIGPTITKRYLSVKRGLDKLRKDKGIFLRLRLLDVHQQPVSENFYWLPDEKGNYSGLQEMAQAAAQVTAKRITKDSVAVTISNPANGPVAFFNRVALVDMQTKKRILPAFYSDNYISVMPGEQKTITISYTAGNETTGIELYGWNVKEGYYAIK
ncbi:glycosyl hydrolase [Chitinophaga agrisoli]|uniref:Glycosyl hydrolase n=1 Tax=Chitinophaga agrisoli TaxID=2607653 RepID=A0A5B2VYH0_9BACT|nr:glycosyl hydrolase [Chitinophaga agrisoli]KAA2244903.1 glycosyl hydrolase [Chitinophaga agrisoli]